MKTFFTCVFLLVSTSNIEAATIQLFNPNILGQPVNNAVVLLSKGSGTKIAPSSIQTDIKDGKYFAATITYPVDTSFSEIKDTLKETHEGLIEKQFSNKHVSFRDENKKIGIMLLQTSEHIQVLYIPFLTTDEIMEIITKNE